ncbi:MAG: DMT family transporter [Firmicutes bacterium]|nr:DMT family transporter [Bacillota bacterium]
MKKNVIFYVLAASLIFSTMEVVLKVAGTTLDPLQMNFLRFFIGNLFLLPFAIHGLKKRGVKLNKGDMGYLVLVGCLCVGIAMLFFQLGVLNAHASSVAVIFCCNPLFTLIFAHFIAGEKMTRRKVLALAICLVGLVFIVNPLSFSIENSMKGMILTILGAVFFGLSAAVGKRRIARIGGLAQTSISGLFGSGVVLIVLLVTGRPVFAGLENMSLPLFLYIAIVVTGMGYFFFYKAMEGGGAFTASIVFFLKPMFAPIVAIIVLQEVITANVLCGIVLIVIASAISLDLFGKLRGKIHGSETV